MSEWQEDDPESNAVNDEHIVHENSLPRYSTDEFCVFDIVRALGAKGWWVRFDAPVPDPDAPRATWSVVAHEWAAYVVHSVEAMTAPIAVCLCALLAVGAATSAEALEVKP